MTYKVAVVDDHILLAQAIEELVNSFTNFEASYLCKNGKELLTKFKDPKNRVDIVLMDVNMPILNGIETTKVLHDEYPDVKVLALSVENEDKTIINMIGAGAKGYLMKDTKKEILEEALTDLIERGSYYTNTVSNILAASLSSKPEEVLKPREIEFVIHACSEKNYKEIADEMCLSPKTIEGYRDSVYEKLNIKNRIGLVLYAIRNNLFKP